MSTRPLVYRSFNGRPVQTSYDSASSTNTKSNGLMTKPCCTQTLHCIYHWPADDSAHWCTCPGLYTEPIHRHRRSLRPNSGPSLAQNRRLFPGRRKFVSGAVLPLQLSSNKDGVIGAYASQIASRRYSPSCRWRSLASFPENQDLICGLVLSSSSHDCLGISVAKLSWVCRAQIILQFTRLSQCLQMLNTVDDCGTYFNSHSTTLKDDAMNF